MGSPSPGLLPGPQGEFCGSQSTSKERANTENQKKIKKIEKSPQPTTTHGDLIYSNPL